MAIVTQRKAFPPGKYRGKLLSADWLLQFAEGTNKALAAGVPVPGLEIHAPLGSDDEATERVSATAGAGWLKEVLVEDDGSIGWKIDVPEKIEQGIKDGTIKFTSPEFRPKYKAADGRYEGPIIRHIAFTPLPKAHDQGAITLAMSEDAFQFGEDDFEGPPDKADDKPAEDDPSTADPPKKNPDSPPKATDKTKTAALVEGMAQLGVVLPSDFDLSNDNALDLMITGLNTAIKAKSEADANKSEEPEQPELKEANAGMPFSEDEIKALPEPLQVKARKANDAAKAAHDQAIQFAEERATSKRKEAVASIKSAKLPPALRKQLLELIENAETVQFSEEGERPTLTVQKAAEMFAAAIPPSLQFSEAELTEPDAGTLFNGGAETEEEAEAIADRIFGKKKNKAA